MPLVDVLLILLVFFMVTSTYLDLDALPLAAPGEAGSGAAAGPGEPSTLLLWISGDGRFVLRGRALEAAGLEAALRSWAQERPGAPVVVLPSGAAPTGALVEAMEAAGRAGVGALRVLRIEDAG